jgi:ATP-dependent Clp protease ATP-binding subunit ClpX
VITALDELSREDLIRTMTEPKDAILKQYQILLEMSGIKLIVHDSALGLIADKAIEKKTGARGLKSIMEDILIDVMFKAPDDDSISEVIVDDDVVNGKKKPVIVTSNHKQVRDQHC